DALPATSVGAKRVEIARLARRLWPQQVAAPWKLGPPGMLCLEPPQTRGAEITPRAQPIRIDDEANGRVGTSQCGAHDAGRPVILVKAAGVEPASDSRNLFRARPQRGHRAKPRCTLGLRRKGLKRRDMRRSSAGTTLAIAIRSRAEKSTSSGTPSRAISQPQHTFKTRPQPAQRRAAGVREPSPASTARRPQYSPLPRIHTA